VGAAVRAPAVQAAWLQLLARIEALREAAGGSAAGRTKGLRKLVRKRLPNCMTGAPKRAAASWVSPRRSGTACASG
jgi:hypothetical protein